MGCARSVGRPCADSARRIAGSGREDQQHVVAVLARTLTERAKGACARGSSGSGRIRIRDRDNDVDRGDETSVERITPAWMIKPAILLPWDTEPAVDGNGQAAIGRRFPRTTCWR